MTRRQELSLVAAILGSGVATIDGSIVNVALPSIERDLGIHTSYLTDLLPALLVFAFGLSMTVAPLTAAVLAEADERDAGIASAINNAVARVAGLVGVSVIGVVVAGTLVGDTFARNAESVRAFHQAIVICAALVGAGGVAGAIGIVNPPRAVEARTCAGGQLVGVLKGAVDCGDPPAATHARLAPHHA